MSDDFDPYHEWLGIEPHEQPVNHYRLLGIAPFTTDQEAIRTAADGRMNDVRRYQMGRRGSHTQPILNALAAAKLCLLNPNTKATYDAVLEAQLQLPQRSAARPRPMPVANANAAPSNTSVQEPPLSEPPAPEPPVAEPPLTEPPVDGNSSQPIVGKRSIARERMSGNASALIPMAIGGGAVLLVVLGVIAYQMNQPVDPPTTANPTPAENQPSQTPSQPTASPEPPAVEASPPTEIASGVVLQQEGEGVIHFPPSAAQLAGDLKLASGSAGDSIDGWATPADRAVWNFHMTQPGSFRLRIEYVASPDELQGTYRVMVFGRDVTRTVRAGNADGSPVADEFTVRAASGGDYQLELIPAKVIGGKLFQLHSIELEPVGR